MKGGIETPDIDQNEKDLELLELEIQIAEQRLQLQQCLQEEFEKLDLDSLTPDQQEAALLKCIADICPLDDQDPKAILASFGIEPLNTTSLVASPSSVVPSTPAPAMTATTATQKPETTSRPTIKPMDPNVRVSIDMLLCFLTLYAIDLLPYLPGFSLLPATTGPALFTIYAVYKINDALQSRQRSENNHLDKTALSTKIAIKGFSPGRWALPLIMSQAKELAGKLSKSKKVMFAVVASTFAVCWYLNHYLKSLLKQNCPDTEAMCHILNNADSYTLENLLYQCYSGLQQYSPLAYYASGPASALLYSRGPDMAKASLQKCADTLEICAEKSANVTDAARDFFDLMYGQADEATMAKYQGSSWMTKDIGELTSDVAHGMGRGVQWLWQQAKRPFAKEAPLALPSAVSVSSPTLN